MTGIFNGTYTFYAYANTTIGNLTSYTTVTFSVAVGAVVYTLTIIPNSGGTTIPAPNIYQYLPSSNMTITALASSSPPYVFTSWIVNNTAGGPANPLQFTIGGNTTVQPIFTYNGGGQQGWTSTSTQQIQNITTYINNGTQTPSMALGPTQINPVILGIIVIVSTIALALVVSFVQSSKKEKSIKDVLAGLG
jgi:hypothetical protein